MSEVKVNWAMLDKAADDVQRTKNQVEEGLGNLDRHVKQLLEVWHGSSRDAFGDVQGQWGKRAEQLKATLHQVQKAVVAANQSYQEHENKVKGSFGG